MWPNLHNNLIIAVVKCNITVCLRVNVLFYQENIKLLKNEGMRKGFIFIGYH
jgi:hypothetical protein